MQTKKRIILGSASPRRRELLEQIGISFEVRVSDKEEVYHSLIPEEIVKELALSKAENVADDLRQKQERNAATVKRRHRQQIENRQAQIHGYHII